MEGKTSLCKLLRSLLDLDMGLHRELLMDYLMGRPTQAIEQRGLDDTENYGCGDDKDEEHWTLVIDQAVECGYVKVRSTGEITIMSKGKKYLKKPVSFELKDEEEDANFEGEDIDGLVADVLSDDSSLKPSSKPVAVKSTTSVRKLQLIQAIDRQIALDDYASNHSLDFEEVLNDLDAIMATGMKLDIRYFCDEVLGEEAISELFDYFDHASSDSLALAFDEYGDVYSREELHLGRILWRNTKI